MPGLPKIVLARMKAKPGTRKSSGGPEGHTGFQGDHHPDANLLAAFAENTLTEKERTRVLHHLAQCAECREVAAFALPAEATAAEPPRVAAGRRWRTWSVLRWGAMAAVLGTLAAVVVLHPDIWKGHQQTLEGTHPPAPSGNGASAPQAVPAAPLAPSPPEPALAKAQVEERESAGKMGAIKKIPEQHQDLVMNDQLARAKAKQQVTAMASSQPHATYRAENVPAAKVEREETKGENAVTAAALPAPAPPPAPNAVTAAAPAVEAKASGEPQSAPAALHSVTQSVEVTAVSGGSIAGAGEGGSVTAPAAKPAPPASAPPSMQMAARASIGGMRVSRKEAALDTGPPAALWSIASHGKVQRSKDGGKNFEQIQVARGIRFRAVAALGSDVWAGGERGALFHSVDGGATWNRGAINFEGNTITEPIVGIQLHDPQHLTVTTASGSQWVSEDGGQSWQKEP